MSGHNIIVIGASTGGVAALQTLVRGLPADLPAAVFVVLHTSPVGPSHLPHILTRAGKLLAGIPSNTERIEPGRIYVSKPDHHLVIRDGFVTTLMGPKESLHRPSVDALFRSAAAAYPLLSMLSA